MKYQQVNLYQPTVAAGFRFNARAMAWVLIAVAGGVALLWTFESLRLTSFRADVAAIEAERNQAEQALADARLKYPAPTPSEAMAAEVATLTDRLTQSRRLNEILSTSSLGDRGGLSSYFEAFARQHLQGLWLREVLVTNGGQGVALVGSAARAELVPTYLKRLSQEQVMRGRAFGALEIQRPAEDPLRVDFATSSGTSLPQASR